MLKISDLTKYFAAFSEAELKEGLSTAYALKNFFEGFFSDDEVLQDKHLQLFVRHALCYPHWQKNSKLFSAELRSLLEQFCLHTGTSLELNSFRWPEEHQCLEIERLSDWTDAIHEHLRSSRRSDEFRLFFDESQQRLIALILQPHMGYEVLVFDRKFFLNLGRLEPLRPPLQLNYGSDLELIESEPQQIDLGTYSLAHFRVVDGTAWGRTSHGYLFEPKDTFAGLRIAESQKLFFALKRIEQFFIAKESDPFYQRLCRDLENCARGMRLDPQTFWPQARATLDMTERVLETVFIGDKLLTLLLRDLQYCISDKQTEIHRVHPSEEQLAVEIPQTPSTPEVAAVTSKEKSWLKKSWFDLTN